MKIKEGILWIYQTVRDQAYYLENSTSGAIWDYTFKNVRAELTRLRPEVSNEVWDIWNYFSDRLFSRNICVKSKI